MRISCLLSLSYYSWENWFLTDFSGCAKFLFIIKELSSINAENFPLAVWVIDMAVLAQTSSWAGNGRKA